MHNPNTKQHQFESYAMTVARFGDEATDYIQELFESCRAVLAQQDGFLSFESSPHFSNRLSEFVAITTLLCDTYMSKSDWFVLNSRRLTQEQHARRLRTKDIPVSSGRRGSAVRHQYTPVQKVGHLEKFAKMVEEEPHIENKGAEYEDRSGILWEKRGS